ncbi:MAG: DUF2950 domain-containing protein [Steroidobacteraceae bacterium]|nr:DUF2950 domain-containing protein [Steroidobacteraceae bacterium]
MNARCARRAGIACTVGAVFLVALPQAFGGPPPDKAPEAGGSAPAVSGARVFATPEQAADELIAAAATFDVPALLQILGPGSEPIIRSGEKPLDRQRAKAFVEEASTSKRVSIEPKGGGRAVLLVGRGQWPFPVPIVKQGNGWVFDAAAGREELLNRRIGSNELDAIEICRGFVTAQREYALARREAGGPTEYAQRIISTPGKRDGLAWRTADGHWEGPIGERIARAIEQGYTSRADPYHGYYFKVLKGQGASAPLGAMDFVIDGLMIGGFALMAAPAQHGETGVKTFIVSHDGVVYEKDLGPDTLQAFAAATRFDPDGTWSRVPETRQ